MVRVWQKICLGVVAALGIAVGLTGDLQAAEETENQSRILIVYYSHSNVTKGIAEQLQQKLGASLHRIEPVNAYPTERQEVLDQAKAEIEKGERPELKGDLPALDDIDLVLIGAPVWFGTLPPPLTSFLSQVDLKGKTVAPFSTYGGGLRGYFDDFKKAVSEEATVTEGLGLSKPGEMAPEDLEKKIAEWTATLPMPKAE